MSSAELCDGSKDAISNFSCENVLITKYDCDIVAACNLTESIRIVGFRRCRFFMTILLCAPQLLRSTTYLSHFPPLYIYRKTLSPEELNLEKYLTLNATDDQRKLLPTECDDFQEQLQKLIRILVEWKDLIVIVRLWEKVVIYHRLVRTYIRSNICKLHITDAIMMRYRDCLEGALIRLTTKYGEEPREDELYSSYLDRCRVMVWTYYFTFNRSRLAVIERELKEYSDSEENLLKKLYTMYGPLRTGKLVDAAFREDFEKSPETAYPSTIVNSSLGIEQKYFSMPTPGSMKEQTVLGKLKNIPNDSIHVEKNSNMHDLHDSDRLQLEGITHKNSQTTTERPRIHKARTYNQRLYNIFERYEPDRIPFINHILAANFGREDELIEKLVVLYGPEPVAEGFTTLYNQGATAEVGNAYLDLNPEWQRWLHPEGNMHVNHTSYYSCGRSHLGYHMNTTGDTSIIFPHETCLVPQSDRNSAFARNSSEWNQNVAKKGPIDGRTLALTPDSQHFSEGFRRLGFACHLSLSNDPITESGSSHRNSKPISNDISQSPSVKSPTPDAASWTQSRTTYLALQSSGDDFGFGKRFPAPPSKEHTAVSSLHAMDECSKQPDHSKTSLETFRHTDHDEKQEGEHRSLHASHPVSPLSPPFHMVSLSLNSDQTLSSTSSFQLSSNMASTMGDVSSSLPESAHDVDSSMTSEPNASPNSLFPHSSVQSSSESTQLVRRYFERYDPKRLARLDIFTSLYPGDDEDLRLYLQKRYGPDPGEPLSATVPQKEVEKKRADEKNMNGSTSTHNRTYRSRLIAMYTLYDPDMLLSNFDAVLQQYSGHEEELLQKLVARFGAEPK